MLQIKTKHNWLLKEEKILTNFNVILGFFFILICEFVLLMLSLEKTLYIHYFFIHNVDCVKIIQLFNKKNLMLMLKIAAKHWFT